MSLDDSYQTRQFRSPEEEVEYELRRFESDDPLEAWDVAAMDNDIDDGAIAW